MTLTIIVPTEIEHALREQALAAGVDFETYASNVLKDGVAVELPPGKRRRLSHEEFRSKIQAIIALHPKTTHVVDDSRDSIYDGRGE